MPHTKQTEAFEAVLHYKRKLNRHVDDPVPDIVLHCLEKLEQIPVNISILQETGIGKVVNHLKKSESTDMSVIAKAREIVLKWKDIVANEEKEQDEQESGESDGSDDDPESGIEEPDDFEEADEEVHQPDDAKSDSSVESHDSGPPVLLPEREPLHSKSSHKEAPKLESSEKRPKKDELPMSKSSTSKEREKVSKDSTSKPSHSKSEASSSTSKSKKKKKEKDREREKEKEKDREREREKDKDKSSKKSSEEKKRKHSESDEGRHKKRKHEHSEDDKHKKSDEKSSKRKHDSSEDEREKSRQKRDKEAKKSSDKKHHDTDKKKDADHKHQESDRKKSHHSSDAAKSKSKSSKKHSSNSSGSTNGFDASSSSKVESSKKDSKKAVPVDKEKDKKSSKPDKETTKAVSQPSHAPTTHNDVAPSANPAKSSPLPERHMFSHLTNGKTDDEALSALIQMSKSQKRTAVYSGSKRSLYGTGGTFPTLAQLCVHKLQENVDKLIDCHNIPYEVLEPILERAKPETLMLVEDYNPYLMESSGNLWERICKKQFPKEGRQEFEAWREMYERCTTARKAKLDFLTTRVQQSYKNVKDNHRKTKLAYVDGVVKGPRSIQRAQDKNGTAAITTQPIRKPGLPNQPRPAIRDPVASSGSSGGHVAIAPNPVKKPKVAPMMAKTLKMVRGLKVNFRR